MHLAKSLTSVGSVTKLRMLEPSAQHVSSGPPDMDLDFCDVGRRSGLRCDPGCASGPRASGSLDSRSSRPRSNKDLKRKRSPEPQDGSKKGKKDKSKSKKSKKSKEDSSKKRKSDGTKKAKETTTRNKKYTAKRKKKDTATRTKKDKKKKENQEGPGEAEERVIGPGSDYVSDLRFTT